MKKISSQQLILLISFFLIFFANVRFFSNIIDVYPLVSENILFLCSLAILFACINIIILSLLCFKFTIKPVLIFILLISSATAYFMDTYNVMIDDSMIDNVLKTDIHEAFDLVSFRQIIYLIVLGILPALFVYKVKIVYPGMKTAIFQRLRLIILTIIIGALTVVSSGNFYASFIREHKPLRYYANPSYYLYSTVRYINSFFKQDSGNLKQIGTHAHIKESDDHRELIIFVLGETARADHFSLNGYQKKTNPLLEKEAVTSFTDVWSCGTSTSYSVPCLFSVYSNSEFNKNKASHTENLLDVLKHAGVNVLWLDNNSSSKGVADRVAYTSYKSAPINPVCDTECRDEGMLSHLQEYINKHPQGDIFIVLHQQGNHGPAYYKRYPSRFEIFTPVCQTNQLEQCTTEEINNAYDNALVYTDYFLQQTIQLLKKNNAAFEAALIYISDHGESLGENGLFLHGLPYMLAPDTQKKVPMIMWFSDSFEKQEVNPEIFRKIKDKRYSHNNIFHTILGLFEVTTSVYNKDLDIIAHDD